MSCTSHVNNWGRSESEQPRAVSVLHGVVQLFVFWEAVGLCSYLLIGYWYEQPTACAAATKAFIVNRVGDFGFILGLLLVWYSFGSLDYSGNFPRARTSPRATS